MQWVSELWRDWSRDGHELRLCASSRRTTAWLQSLGGRVYVTKIAAFHWRRWEGPRSLLTLLVFFSLSSPTAPSLPPPWKDIHSYHNVSSSTGRSEYRQLISSSYNGSRCKVWQFLGLSTSYSYACNYDMLRSKASFKHDAFEHCFDVCSQECALNYVVSIKMILQYFCNL